MPKKKKSKDDDYLVDKIEAQEQHKPVIRKFQRRKVLVSGIHDTWAADLVDMQAFQKQNKGYRFILTVIDVLSRYAWAEPLKDKKSETVILAFKKIFRMSGAKPDKLWVDQGSEFINKKMKDFIKPTTIYHTYGEHKAAMIERFNRTLKTRMWYKFTKHDTHEWVNRLPKLMKKYNNTVHSSIGMTPTKALSEEPLLLQIQNAAQARIPYKPPKLKVGDFVRLSEKKDTFAKGYHNNWTKELFQIADVLSTKPVTYRLKDQKGETIEGSAYELELQKSKLRN